MECTGFVLACAGPQEKSENEIFDYIVPYVKPSQVAETVELGKFCSFLSRFNEEKLNRT